MIPPEERRTDPNGDAATPPAVSVCAIESPKTEILRKRGQFLAASRARRQSMPGFTLQARRRDGTEAAADLIRVGFTCSKKVGNAVARNRAKRRLREIARLTLPGHGKPGWDYVLVGRRDITATRNFELLQNDLQSALARLHGGA